MLHSADSLHAEGDVLDTVHGAKTTPFPRIDCSTERRCRATTNRVDAWLRSNAIAVAESRGGCVELPGWRTENPKNMPPATKDAMHLYLFGTC